MIMIFGITNGTDHIKACGRGDTQDEQPLIRKRRTNTYTHNTHTATHMNTPFHA
jgi:hypothetical protein